jgi:hypothetical protein
VRILEGTGPDARDGRSKYVNTVNTITQAQHLQHRGLEVVITDVVVRVWPGVGASADGNTTTTKITGRLELER